MIRLEQVAFDYGERFALNIPQLSIDQGQAVAVVGPSGSGKTTLLNLIAGILVPRAGTIHVGDAAVSAMADHERRRFRSSQIGLVFQEIELLEYLRVHENVLLPFRINRGLTLTAEAKQRVITLADDAGIADKLDRYPAALSQGERQRVAICRALVSQPPLLLADEPTSSLDGDTAGRVLDTLFAMVRQRNATLMMLTHDRSVLDRFDRIIDMRELQADQGIGGATPAATSSPAPKTNTGGVS